MTVTLLGTGTPEPRHDRFGPATLVQAGGLNFVFDTGRGIPIRLSQLGISMGRIDAVFITHYHSDHLNGLSDFWTAGYLGMPWGTRARPMELWGPTGTMYGPTGAKRVAAAMRETFRDDVGIRMADEKVKEVATQIDAHDFPGDRDGVILERNGVRVTAFQVNHGPLIKPAVGYRIDCAGHSVLISGDTKFDENVIAHGEGVDLLIHEVAAFPAPLLATPLVRAVFDHHTSPEQAGIVFARAKPKLAAYTHIVIAPPLDVRGVINLTRKNYKGPLVVRVDLMRFAVATEVTVQAPQG